MKDLLNLLNECCPDVDFENETSLIDDGVHTSLDIVMIVGELNDVYDISITVDELEPENFNSASAIFALVERLRNE
ncbi:MAG: acyl carrier protein [Clostridiales bacterium]|nr:acyl carrier protein [Clostridiales bacterium]